MRAMGCTASLASGKVPDAGRQGVTSEIHTLQGGTIAGNAAGGAVWWIRVP